MHTIFFFDTHFVFQSALLVSKSILKLTLKEKTYETSNSFTFGLTV